MKFVLKTFCSTLALACILTAPLAHAEDSETEATVSEQTTKPRAVLFKIHDIEPVTDAEGVVTNCDFMVTFYNRTDESFRQAKLNLGWEDNVSSRFEVDQDSAKEEKVVKEQPRNARYRSVDQKESKASSMEVTTSVTMPSLSAYKQASVKATVKTAKCFLLLDNVEFDVASCNMISKNTTETTSRRSRMVADRSDSECAGLFEYVDSKNPEYYDEFKKISYSDQAKLLGDEKVQDTSDIKKAYDQVVTNINHASATLDGIK
jgi:hypothetical protein